MNQLAWKRHFQILKSFQSFVRSKTIAGRLPKKVNVIKRKLLYLVLLLQETVTPMSHFSALLDNVIILMKGIHRNIMKNDMIVQWKIKLFETPWFQSTAQRFSCVAVRWSQHNSFASRYSHYLENWVEFSWVLVSVYLDISLGKSLQALCMQGASATELHLNFIYNHRQSPFGEGEWYSGVNSSTPLSCSTINFCCTWFSFKNMKYEYTQNVAK